jgi:hypothetical protein
MADAGAEQPAPTIRTVPEVRARARARGNGLFGHCSPPQPASAAARGGAAWRATVSSAPRSTVVNSRARPPGGFPGAAARTGAARGRRRVPDGGHHAPDDPVAPECRVSSTSCRAEASSRRALSAAIGPSSSSTPASARDRLRPSRALDLRDVDLRHPERGVREHVGEVAVVREDEQPARLGIQPADVVEPLVPVLREAAQVGRPARPSSTRRRRSAC